MALTLLKQLLELSMVWLAAPFCILSRWVTASYQMLLGSRRSNQVKQQRHQVQPHHQASDICILWTAKVDVLHDALIRDDAVIDVCLAAGDGG